MSNVTATPAELGEGGAAQPVQAAPAVEPASKIATPYIHGREFALWDKYEEIAMHFNDLIMKLRTQALGGLTGIVAISGIAINLTAKPESRMEWEILFATIVFFFVAWTALWILAVC